jgi:hypothetical protein
MRKQDGHARIRQLVAISRSRYEELRGIYAAHLADCVESDLKLGTVWSDEAHPVAWFDTNTAQAMRESVRLSVKMGEGQASLIEGDRSAVGILRSCRAKDSV